MRHVRIDEKSGCWLWTASTHHFWYGVIRVGAAGSKMMLAHRASWLIAFGPFPEEMCVLHKCDVPGCVNPEHLFLGTRVENLEDMTRKNRRVRGERMGMAKLTPEKVAAIRLMKKAGATGAEVGRAFGISKSHANTVAAKRQWRHL